MLTIKTKLIIHYIGVLGLFIVWTASFYFKWVFLAWLLFPIMLWFSYLTNPVPKTYRAVYQSRFTNICLVVFSIIAICIGVLNIAFADIKPSSSVLKKIDNYGIFALIMMSIPVAILSIREEIKYAIKADEEANAKRGVK